MSGERGHIGRVLVCHPSHTGVMGSIPIDSTREISLFPPLNVTKLSRYWWAPGIKSKYIWGHH